MANRILKDLKYKLKFLPDEAYIQLYYFAKFRKFCNLKNPYSFNEKIQWLKLHDRNPLYTTLVDKIEVKKYVADLIGEEYIIPTLGVWDNPDDIDFDKLPDQFVLKCNHDSGEVFICKDKETFDIEYTKSRLKKLLTQDFYLVGREWPYKNVKRKVLAEKYMVDESRVELKDYKIFCFGGIPKLIEVDFDRFVDHKRNLYTVEWQYVRAESAYPTDENRVIQRPLQLEKMLEIAKSLSKGIPFLRVDLYVINNEVYFGELTFYHESGFGRFLPAQFEETLGEWIELPEKLEL